MKQYKTYVRHRVNRGKFSVSSPDPFLCLHLLCPPRSYDVNVEPAKDQVLFTEPDEVAKMLENFLEFVYGELSSSEEHKPTAGSGSCERSSLAARTGSVKKLSVNRALDDVELGNDQKSHSVADTYNDNSSLEKLRVTAVDRLQQQKDEPHSELSMADRILPLPLCGKLHRNMDGFDNDNMEMSESPTSLDSFCEKSEDESEIRKPTVTNPWMLAKLNAPLRKKASARKAVSDEKPETPRPEDTLTEGPDDSAFLPPVYQNPGPPIRRLQRPGSGQTEPSPTGSNNQNSVWDRSSQFSQAQAKCSFSLRAPRSSLSPVSGSNRENGSERSKRGHVHIATTMTQAMIPATGLEQHEPHTKLRKPFKPHFHTSDSPFPLRKSALLTPGTSPSLETETSAHTSLMRNQNLPLECDTSKNSPAQLHPHPFDRPPSLHPSPPSDPGTTKYLSSANQADLDEIMDFEYRKKAVNTLGRREHKPSSYCIAREKPIQMQKGLLDFSQSFKLSNPSTHYDNLDWDMNRSVKSTYNDQETISSGVPAANMPQKSHAPKKNLHQNRYEAARAALSRRASITADPGAFSDQHKLDSTFYTTDPPHFVSSLSGDDPRAHLISHIAERRRTEKVGHGPTHKIKRVKTSQLPFETISPDLALQGLSLRMALPARAHLEAQIKTIKAVDSYVVTGVNKFAGMSDSSPAFCEGLRGILGRLITEQYVAKSDSSANVPVTIEDSMERVKFVSLLRASSSSTDD